MSERRGLTLIEVLLATALLGVLAAATLPLFASAPLEPDATDSDVDDLQLKLAADDIVDDPNAFGIEELASVDRRLVHWPEHPDRPPIVIERLTTEAPDSDAYWLVFRCDGRFVLHLMTEPEGGDDKP